MKNLNQQKVLLLLVTMWWLAGFDSSTAQVVTNKSTPSLDNICRMHDDGGSFIFFKESLRIDPKTIFKTYRSDFGIHQNDEMNLYRTQPFPQGAVTIYRYQQYHEGIKVHGAVMNVFEKNGIAEKANGRLIKDLTYTTPLLSKDDALQIALGNIDPTEYQWTDPVLVSKFSGKKKLAGKNLDPDPELVYMYRKKSERNAFDETAYELCWGIRLNLKHGKSKEIFISAANGKLVNELPLTLNCSPDFEFALPFNGVQKVLCSYVGNDCTPYGNMDQFICDNYGGLQIETEDYDNSSNICFDISFYTPKILTGVQADGAQVQWGIQKALDYYWMTFNWRSYDNDYGDVDANVNVSFSDNNGNNAAYDEMWEDFDFGYGYSKTDEFDSYTCLDIVGHEYTHGVDDYTADLDYSDESGALDESYADIFGEMVETWEEHDYMDPSFFDWLVAGDKSTGYVRSMSNPNIKEDPDTYKGNFWCDYTNGAYFCTADDDGGVHTNSGVQNFMFYLLVMGGTGTNDNGTYYNVTPIDPKQAAAIAFLSHTYLWGSAEYSDARDAWIQAAIDLYGNCSQQAISVGQAWRAVGVGLTEPGYDMNLCDLIVFGNYQAINNITTNGAYCDLNAIPTFGNIYFIAGNEIVFTDGTILSGWGNNMVYAGIDPCSFTIHKEAAYELPAVGDSKDFETKEYVLSIYPNPATDFTTVKNSGAGSPSTLKIYTSTMQLIRTINFENGIENKIETHDLPAGIYFVEMIANGKSVVEKLVISR